MGAALGLGLQEGDVAISLGTSGTVFAVCRAPTHDATGAVAGFADATGRFLPLACTLNATKVTDTMARLLGRSRDDLEQLALACPPGAGGVVLLPYLDGERTPNLPDATGTLAGLRTDTEPAQLARAAYEGVVCGLLDAFDALRRRRRRDRRRAESSSSVAGRTPRCTRNSSPTSLQRPVEVAATGRVRGARRVRPGRRRAHRSRRRDRVARVGAHRRHDSSNPIRRSTPRPCAPTYRDLLRRTSSRVGSRIVIRTSFNDDWRVPSEGERLHGTDRRRRAAVGAGASASRRDDRRDARRRERACDNGYFPGGVWEYQKTFVVPEDRPRASGSWSSSKACTAAHGCT